MNRERAKELLPIIQAFAEGKEIQSKWSSDTGWGDCDKLITDDGVGYVREYRIKPEPREFWTIGNKTYMGSSKGSQSDAERFLSELRAENPHTDYKDWNVFKVREVIE